MYKRGETRFERDFDITNMMQKLMNIKLILKSIASKEEIKQIVKSQTKHAIDID